MKIALCSLIFLSCFCFSLSLYQGTSVTQASARFVAAIKYRRRDSNNYDGFLCAATFVNRYNILTSASCVHGQDISLLRITMGGTNLNRRDFYSRVQRITIHPRFNHSDPLTFNLAVLRLASFNAQGNRNIHNYVQPINLADSTPDSPESCQLIAWGDDPNLKHADLPVWQQSLCPNASNGTFCAGNLNNGPAVCPNNLGGSFICNNQFAGFAIEDSGCNQQNRPGYFHSVDYHRDWILEVSKANIINQTSLLLVALTVVMKIWL
jgi:secreted trypsin-like serine protease